MNEQALRFRVGVFVLASLLLLAVLITLFGGSPTFFKRHDRYTILFSDASGVAPGTPVRRSGVRIGEVGSVKLVDESAKVHVGILIEKPYRLYQGDQPTLVHGLLSGDTTIDFVPKRPDLPGADLVAVEPNSELLGATQANVGALINQAADIVPTAQESLNQIRATLQRFEKMAPLMEDTLKEYRELGKIARETAPELRRTNDEINNTARNWGRLGERLDLLVQTNQDELTKSIRSLTRTLDEVSRVFNEENRKNLEATLRNVKAGSDNLESITKNTDEILKEGRQTIKRVNDSVGQADQVLANLQRATKPLADRGDSVMKNLDESAAKLNLTLTDVRELLRAAGQDDGTLRRFLGDPALYNNLNDAACQLNRVLPRVDRILRDMEVFADKIARHPESLGVGGAINPSSGLKTVPAGTTSWRNPGH